MNKVKQQKGHVSGDSNTRASWRTAQSHHLHSCVTGGNIFLCKQPTILHKVGWKERAQGETILSPEDFSAHPSSTAYAPCSKQLLERKK